MPKFEEVAGKVFWAVGTFFVAVLVLAIGWGMLDNQFPDLLRREPMPAPKAEPEVFMPPLEDIKLVLGRDEVRNPGDRVNNAMKECIGRPPALIGMGGSRLEEFLADATEKDIFFFYCAPPEVWEMLAGRAGFVKVREGKPVDELTLVMN